MRHHFTDFLVGIDLAVLIPVVVVTFIELVQGWIENTPA